MKGIQNRTPFRPLAACLAALLLLSVLSGCQTPGVPLIDPLVEGSDTSPGTDPSAEPASPGTDEPSGTDTGEPSGTDTQPEEPGTQPGEDHAHVFGPWEITVPASCTEDGTRTRRCVCGEAETERVPAGHTPVVVEGVVATRTEGGLSDGVVCAACGEVLTPQAETPPYDPVPLPVDALSGVLIAAVCGVDPSNTDAPASHGFVELYNATDKAVALSGASLFGQKLVGDEISECMLPADAVIPAHGYYLVRARTSEGHDPASVLVDVDSYDTRWDYSIDNKEIRLILAPSGLSAAAGDDVLTHPEAADRFLASDTPAAAVYAVTGMSKSKIAVRTALCPDSGFHKVNLAKAGLDELHFICPRTSSGKACTVRGSLADALTFSHDAGVYPSAIELTITAPAGCEIRYTLDGSDPRTSRTAKTCTAPLTLADSSALPVGPTSSMWSEYSYTARPGARTLPGGYVVKACGVTDDGTTDVYTNTYFITDLTQYGVTLISLSLPAEEMVGRDGFYSAYTRGDITEERPRGMAVMETFDPAGDRVGYSVVEAAVSGNGSSGRAQKSLKLYFKGKNNDGAGLQSDLDYDLFGGLCRDADGKAVMSFSRLQLRNSGNDCRSAFMRDAYMQRMAAGLHVDTLAAAHTLVFVNGEFWGVYNVRERYCPEYVESHYGVDKDNVVIVESDYAALVYEHVKDAPYVLCAGEAGDENAFNALSDFIINHDMSLAENYETVCAQMDTESFMDLFAVRLYFNARDFPENNMKVWRNKDPEDPSGMDTKWHFGLLDTDMGLSFYVGENDTSEVSSYFSWLTCDTRAGKMMKSLLANPGFSEDFIARCYEIFTVHMDPERLSTGLETMIADLSPLMKLQEDRWRNDGALAALWNAQPAVMRRFVSDRQTYVLRFLHESEQYTGLTADEVRAIITARFGEDVCAS